MAVYIIQGALAGALLFVWFISRKRTLNPQIVGRRRLLTIGAGFSLSMIIAGLMLVGPHLPFPSTIFSREIVTLILIATTLIVLLANYWLWKRHPDRFNKQGKVLPLWTLIAIILYSLYLSLDFNNLVNLPGIFGLIVPLLGVALWGYILYFVRKK